MNISAFNAADRWGLRTTFVLALSASAVGMGNLWRFSYLTGEYGGGAFVIIYVLCLLLIAVPSWSPRLHWAVTVAQAL